MSLLFKKVIYIGVILIMIFNLLSCKNILIYDSDLNAHLNDALHEEIKTIAISLLKTLEEKDKQAFKDLLSKTTLNKADYQLGEDYSFGIYSGELVSITEDSLHTGSHRSSVDASYTTAAANFDVITSTNQYKIYIEYFSTHDNETLAKKITGFKILEASNLPESGYFSDMGGRHGIYYPFWDNE